MDKGVGSASPGGGNMGSGPGGFLPIGGERDEARCPCGRPLEMVEIHVNPTTGGQFQLRVAASDSIEYLRKMVSKRLRVPKERICLLYRDRHLRAGTLEENFIVDGARITLLPSVETGLLTQRPEQSVMQALESLNDGQVNDFLTGKAPLNLTMRLGDHMMLIQLQLSTVSPTGGRKGSSSGSSSGSRITSSGSSSGSVASSHHHEYHHHHYHHHHHHYHHSSSPHHSSMVVSSNSGVTTSCSSPTATTSNSFSNSSFPSGVITTSSVDNKGKANAVGVSVESPHSSSAIHHYHHHHHHLSAATSQSANSNDQTSPLFTTPPHLHYHYHHQGSKSTTNTSPTPTSPSSAQPPLLESSEPRPVRGCPHHSGEGTDPKASLDTKALAEASRNLTQTLKQLSSEVLTTKPQDKESTHSSPSSERRKSLEERIPCSSSSKSKRQGAIIESMHHHGKGVYSGTFSGTLNPALQDKQGRPKRDISTIIHILNDLLCATPQYRRHHHNHFHQHTSNTTSGGVTTTALNTASTSSSVTATSCSSTTNKSSSRQLVSQNRTPSISGCSEGHGLPERVETVNDEDPNMMEDDNQVTRTKLEHLRLIMEQRRARRKARREARASPYTHPKLSSSSDPWAISGGKTPTEPTNQSIEVTDGEKDGTQDASNLCELNTGTVVA